MRQATAAKRAREQRVKERRTLKQEKKAAAREAKAAEGNGVDSVDRRPMPPMCRIALHSAASRTSTSVCRRPLIAIGCVVYWKKSEICPY